MIPRLPTQQLDAFVPAPYEQRTTPPPWRGALVVGGLRSADRAGSQQIHVTAVEIDGEKAQQWPTAFVAAVLYDRPVLPQFTAWMRSVQPLPLCSFMPNRIRDANQRAVNDATFHALAAMLHDAQTVAVAPWAPATFPGAGIVIYPCSNSSALLMGALFFDASFPPFLAYAPGAPSPSLSPTSPVDHFRYAMRYPDNAAPQLHWSVKAEDAPYPEYHQPPPYP